MPFLHRLLPVLGLSLVSLQVFAAPVITVTIEECSTESSATDISPIATITASGASPSSALETDILSTTSATSASVSGGVYVPALSTQREVVSITASAAASSTTSSSAEPNSPQDSDPTSDPPASTTSASPTTSTSAAAAAATSAVVTPALPVNGGPTELPASQYSLKHIAIGHGIQNYTCASSTASPVAIGALATLFDVTGLDGNVTEINSLPPKVAFMALPTPPETPLTVTTPLQVAGLASPLPIAGYHYFGADGTPTFDLTAAFGQIIFGKKIDDIKAPATASVGPDGNSAVDWLYLTAKPGYPTVGLTDIYRVVTAGGSAPSCAGQGSVISIPYSAEYWFYG